MHEDHRNAELESRLAADERRLLQDEERLEVEAEQVQRDRAVAYVAVALAMVLAVAVVALVLAVLALDGDVGTLSRRSAPASSVGASALRDGSVTAAKLAPGAVGPEALAAGSVGTTALRPAAVFGPQVAADALTGADIREGTLATVPHARDAERLGNVAAGAFLASPVLVQEMSVTDTEPIKGPVIVRCPAGARVLSGGAAIEGAAAGAALVRNAPDGVTGWTATARVDRGTPASWRLVVTAICAVGGR